MYLTHWLLYFKPLRIWFQRKKIPGISRTAEIRPYSNILGTNNVEIGERVIIPPGTILSTYPNNPNSKIVIENDVLLGPNVSIYSSTHNFDDTSIPIKDQGYNVSSVLLKKGCWIGVNSVILPGVTIGQNAVIGANSVVTKDVPDYTIAAGSPAREIRNLKVNKK
ncbi:MAG: acyltransferase [Flavobacteriales bacterium]|nr:acyltransferase [Flavobacteriales bacterium]